MIETVLALIKELNGLVWGVPMLILILGTGLYLSVGLKLVQFRKFAEGFTNLWSGRESKEEGEISPFNALMTSLSATVGTGNIAGVATAIVLGGPGAIFWMWMTALVGMATKYSEAVLAVHYREVDEEGNHVGGPMYYIKNGMGPKWKWLGGLFALFAMLAGFGIGNTIQANSVAHAMESSFGFSPLYVGLLIAVLVFMVLLGGVKRIASVAGKLVPLMAILYVSAALVAIILNFERIPDAFATIFTYAFTPAAAVGGFAGATVMAAIQFGVARGIFSNEAGLGSAPIAHAAAKTNSPVRQGLIAMLGTFIDTLVICTMTALVIIASGVWTDGANGAALSSLAFESFFPGVGGYIVALGLSLFAFSTLLGWSLYGEKSAEYLFGVRSKYVFRLLWVAVIPLGAMSDLNTVWLIADTLNALMAIPNLIALAVLSPVVFALSRAYKK